MIRSDFDYLDLPTPLHGGFVAIEDYLGIEITYTVWTDDSIAPGLWNLKVTYDDDHGNSGELFDPGFLDDLDEAIEVGSAVSDDIFAGAYDDIFYSEGS